jgi:hypothetical protein
MIVQRNKAVSLLDKSFRSRYKKPQVGLVSQLQWQIRAKEKQLTELRKEPDCRENRVLVKRLERELEHLKERLLRAEKREERRKRMLSSIPETARVVIGEYLAMQDEKAKIEDR